MAKFERVVHAHPDLGGLLVGYLWVFVGSATGGPKLGMVQNQWYLYLYIYYVYIYLMGIESKNLDGSAPNPIPSGHQTWLAEKTHLVRGFPTIMFDYQRVCHSKNHIYLHILVFWFTHLDTIVFWRCKLATDIPQYTIVNHLVAILVFIRIHFGFLIHNHLRCQGVSNYKSVPPEYNIDMVIFS